MTHTPPAWLAEACDHLFRPGGGSHDTLRGRAAALGATAAARSVTIADTVDELIRAAADRWHAVAAPDAAAAGHDLLASLREIAAAVLDGYHRSAHDAATRRDEERTAFVEELLAPHTDPGRLAAGAQRHGIRLSGRHTVVVARGPDLTEALAHSVDDALSARFGAANILTSIHDGDLICICAGGLRGVPAELARHLHSRLSGGWQAAVGRTHPGLAGLATSLDEARNALHLADRLGFTAPVLYASDLLVFPVLLRDHDAITDLVSTVLGPLTGARGGARPYLDTLAALFDNEGNHSATARQLHISVRAVTYRLDRVHALTGYHPGEPTQRFTLHTAVLGARLLGWPAEPDKRTV